MHYHSLIGIAAAALSLTFPASAVAQSVPESTSVYRSLGQPSGNPGYRLELVSFDLRRGSAGQPMQLKSAAYSVEPASPVSSSESPSAVPEDPMRIVPDERTKSAAYKWEAGFLALSAIDAAETISCLNRNRCTEGNFIWGHHPSTGTIVAAKLGLGLVHLGIIKLIADRDPHTALRAAQISAAVQGGVVLLHLNKAF